MCIRDRFPAFSSGLQLPPPRAPTNKHLVHAPEAFVGRVWGVGSPPERTSRKLIEEARNCFEPAANCLQR
eukprot:10861466-Alexandrium_andersonii.AAC.1